METDNGVTELLDLTDEDCKDFAECLVQSASGLRAMADGFEVSTMVVGTRCDPQAVAELARARITPPIRTERVILLDDLLVKGTQAMACMIAMRRAGHTGPIEAYFVHQSVAPNPTDDQRQPFLEHRILWDEGQRLARRIEVGCWHRTPAAAAAGG